MHVVDLTTSLAGPSCTAILAGLGAGVVKVERPDGGDEARAWGPPFWDGDSVLFLAANPGKRSLALDLKQAPAREALARLLECSDVFVQSLRPGAAERIGLGGGELRRRHPRLVTCAIGAFGRVGPLQARPGYDPLMQAAAGIMSVTGEAGGGAVRVGTSLVDFAAGLWAALGVLAALQERERTGVGREVDLSLYETALGLMSYHLLGYLASGELPERAGTGFPLIAPYQSFATADGELMVAAANDRLFARLCESLPAAELRDDPRFVTNAGRVEHRAELVALLEPRFRGATTDELVRRLSEAGVPAAPVHDIAQVAAHEQTDAVGMVQRDLRTVALPLSVDGERLLQRSAPPPLGAHTVDVLTELRYSAAEIDRLAVSGAIVVGKAPAR